MNYEVKMYCKTIVEAEDMEGSQQKAKNILPENIEVYAIFSRALKIKAVNIGKSIRFPFPSHLVNKYAEEYDNRDEEKYKGLKFEDWCMENHPEEFHLGGHR